MSYCDKFAFLNVGNSIDKTEFSILLIKKLI